MSTSGQLPLPFNVTPRYGRDDFLVGRANAAAFDAVLRVPRWLSPALMITGPEGSGKSHLAAIFTERANATQLRADHLTFAAVPELAARPALVIEDADRFQAEERAFFHLLNLARERGIFVLITARMAPEAWGLETADLLSRLRAAPRQALSEPDDALLSALLVKLFADRQLEAEPSLIAYALPRIERSYRAVQQLVADLDRLSLIRKRPIGRAMVAECLGFHEGDGSE